MCVESAFSDSCVPHMRTNTRNSGLARVELLLYLMTVASAYVSVLVHMPRYSNYPIAPRRLQV